MKKSSWIRTAAVGLGLAAVGMLYGQSSKAPEPSLYKTQDGILDTNYFNRLPRDTDTDVNSLLEGGNVTSLTALDPISVLKGKLNYLKKDLRPKNFYNSEENPKTYTAAEEARFRLINIYEQLLTKVSSEKRTPEYYKSLEKLAKSISVSDPILTTKELEGILGGLTYVLDKQGKKSNGQGYDVPMLVYFPEVQTTQAQSNAGTGSVQIQSQPPALLTPLPPRTTDVPRNPAANESLITPKTGYNEKQALPLPETPIETPKKKSDLELSVDVLASPNMVGGRVGLTGKLFDLGSGIETRGGIGISGAYGFSETVSSSKSDPNSATGRYFVYTTTNENMIKLGLDASLSIGDKNGNLFIGGGPNVWIYGQKSSVDLFDSSGSIKPNSNTELGATLGLDAYLGYQVKWLRFLVGFDTMKKFYGETGVSIPL